MAAMRGMRWTWGGDFSTNHEVPGAWSIAARMTVSQKERAAALVEALGADLLEHFDYRAPPRPAALAAAKAELAISEAREATQGLGARLRFAVQTYQHHRRRLKHELEQQERTAAIPELRPNIAPRRR